MHKYSILSQNIYVWRFYHSPYIIRRQCPQITYASPGGNLAYSNLWVFLQFLIFMTINPFLILQKGSRQDGGVSVLFLANSPVASLSSNSMWPGDYPDPIVRAYPIHFYTSLEFTWLDLNALVITWMPTKIVLFWIL